MPESIVTTERPAEGGPTGTLTGNTQTTQLTAADELVEADLLVEDISIDGMCGVY